jgi:hypothetical protein
MSLTDNRTLLNDCEDSAQTFVTTGGQLGTSALTGQFIEASGSVEAQHSNVYDDTYTSGDSAGNTFNLGSAGADTTIYMGIKDNLMQAIAAAGGTIVLGDGTDRIGYTCVGGDVVGLPYANQFFFCKLDTSVAAAAPGTADVDHHVFAGTEANLDFSNLTIVGFGTIHNAKAQGNVPNVFIDNIRYMANDAAAASILGGTVGTPEEMTDVVGDDITLGAGMFNNPKGSEFGIFAPTEWGDNVGTADSYFEGIDEQWYFIGDNAGSRAVGATHFPMAVVGNATGTNSFELTNCVLVNVGQRSEFDFSDVNVDILNHTGVTFTSFGAITFPANSATKDLVRMTFNDCGMVYFDDLDVDRAIFNGAFDALGAMLLDESHDATTLNQVTTSFTSDGTGHAIHVNLTGDGAGAGGAFEITIDDITVSGYEASDLGSTGNTVFLVDNDNDNDVEIIITGGTGTFSYERAAGYVGTVTITQAVTVTITALDEITNLPIQFVRAFLELTIGGLDVIDPGTLTDVNGEVSVQYSGSTPVAAEGYLAKGSESPTYKRKPIGGMITGDGLDQTITLVSDGA